MLQVYRTKSGTGKDGQKTARLAMVKCPHPLLYRKKDTLKVNELFDYVGKKGRDWQDFIEEHDCLQEIKEIRQQTIRGRPLGEGTFLKKLEKKLNRLLIIRSAGRPKREK